MNVNKNTTSTSITLAVLAIIFGGLLGWGVANISVSNGMGSALPLVGIGGSPIDQNLKFEELVSVHNEAIVLYLQALYDKKDAIPAEKQLDSNSNQMANIITGKFGEAAGAEFLHMWRDHIKQHANYAKGLKINDGDKMQMSKQRLEQLAIEKGYLLHNLNQNINAEETANLLNEHNVLITSIIDSYAREGQENMINQINESKNQSTKLATYLANNLFSSSLSLTAPQ